MSSGVACYNNTSYHYYRGPWDVLKRTIQGEGFGALYRGFGAVIYGGTPATVLYLSTYEISKLRLTEIMCSASTSTAASSADNIPNTTTTTTPRGGGGDMSDFVIHFGSGMLAEAVSCIVFVPVDVVKERLQVQHGTTPTKEVASGGRGTKTTTTTTMAYKNSWDALSRISQTEGILALYKGYGATLLSFGTFSGLFFLLYEHMLLQVRRRHLSSSEQQPQGLYCYSVDDYGKQRQQQVVVPFHWTLICSCSAGAVASWITSPLDMAKLRLQVQRGQLAAAATAAAVSSSSSSSAAAAAAAPMFQYRNIWHCLQHSYQTAGVQGLFRGAGARVLHFAPSTTVTMTSFETFRTFFARILADRDGDGD
jgi:Mitochondrial carrier protein